MDTFEDFNLDSRIIKAIGEMGFVSPTPIQKLVIPELLVSANDLVGLAQTGTGKTAAFGLPMISKADIASKHVQGLILSPTRELCIQIAKDLESYSKYIDGFKVTAVYGGASIEPQITKLNKGTHIVVGTPGRTLDLLKRKRLKIGDISTIVLDEADEMLSMGFKDDLDAILEKTPSEKQTLLFSATMPTGIAKIASKFMTNPIELSAGKRNEAATTVKHIYYEVQAKDRYEALKRIADIDPNIYGIIFCRTRRETKEVADKLIQDSYNADALHGDLSQAQRDTVMNKFRTKHLQLLVATDVAARGLDVDELTHVINYNLPDENEIYIHRSGRTGRAGKKGISLSILHMREKHKLRAVEKIIGKKFERMQVPSGKQVCEKQLFNLIDRIENVDVDEDQIASFLDVVYKKLDWLSREELIKRFMSVEFNRFLAYYKNSRDLNIAERPDSSSRNRDRDRDKDRDRSKRRSRSDDGAGFTRFFINIGSADKLTPPSIIGLINKYTKDRNIAIGRIEIMKNFSFFEVDESYKDVVLKSLNKGEFNDVSLNVEVASKKPIKSKSSRGSYDRGSDSRSGDNRNDRRKNRFKSDRPKSDRPNKRRY